MNAVNQKLHCFAKYFEQNTLVTSFCLLVIILIFTAWLQWTPYFPDPDSFYHIKIAQLMRESGAFVTDFPWLPLTVLPDIYADQAWAYHVLLIPFTYFPDPLIGLKAATALFATLSLMVIYLVLKKLKIKYTWAYILLLLFSPPFIFRLSLAKPSALAVAMLVLGLYLLTKPQRHNKKKNTGIFFLSFLYVWLHGSWPLLVISSFIYWIVGGGFNFQKKYYSLRITGYRLLKSLIKSLLDAPEKKLFLASILGAASGLIINPYFPKNLIFFWNQTVLIAVKNYSAIIGVGSEWYGIGLPKLIGTNIIITLTASAALIVFTMRIKKQNKTTWALLTITVFLLVITLKSRRNGEYLTPASVIFTASVLNSHSKTAYEKMRAIFKNELKKNKKINNVAVLFVVLSVISHLGFSVYSYTRFKTIRYHITMYEKLSVWMKKNILPGTNIVNTHWEDFPILFYRNPELRYTIGLDPTFLYLASPKRYEYWNSLIQKPMNIAPEEIQKNLSSQVLLVKNTDARLKNMLQKNTKWTERYHDNEISIFSAQNDYE